MPLRLLIVEDEQTLARNIATFLRQRAIEVEIANTITQAIGHLESLTEFDVLLLDVDLPDGDGLHFYRNIRPAYPNIKMIAMSGRNLDIPEIVTRKAGGISFLAKPFALSRILDVLEYVAPETTAPTQREFPSSSSLPSPQIDEPVRSISDRPSAKIRIVVYSHDTYGLGNIRRMIAITQELVAENSKVSVLIISGSPMLHNFRLAPGIDYVKLPSLSRDESGIYGSRALDWDYNQLLELRSNKSRIHPG